MPTTANTHTYLQDALSVGHIQVTHANYCKLTHLHDDLPVGHHHGHSSEQGFEVLRQLLATGVPGVHGDKEAHAWVHGHLCVCMCVCVCVCACARVACV